MLYIIDNKSGPEIYGIEKAQLTRLPILEELEIEYQLIYFLLPNIPDIYQRFLDFGFPLEKVELIYHAFTDVKNSPVTYRLEEFIQSFGFERQIVKIEERGKVKIFHLANTIAVWAYLTDKGFLAMVEMYLGDCLLNRLQFTYCLLSEERFSSNETDKSKQTLFYNEDGSLAYTIVQEGEQIEYIVGKDVLSSERDFFEYYWGKKGLSKDDILLFERNWSKFHFLLDPKKRSYAKLGYYIHYDFQSELSSPVLHREQLPPLFSNSHLIDFFIATVPQQVGLLNQLTVSSCFNTYIPVGIIPIGDEKNFEKDTPLKLVTVSRLTEEKRVDLLLHLMRELQIRGYSDIELTIVGAGGKEGLYRRMVTDLGLGKVVKMVGFQSNVQSFYEMADLYVSTSGAEAFATSVIEAMGAGLPVIGRDVPYANQNYICHRKNGYLVTNSPLDQVIISEMADVIIEFKQKPIEERKKMSLAAQERAKEFSFARCKQSWKQFLQQIVK